MINDSFIHSSHAKMICKFQVFCRLLVLYIMPFPDMVSIITVCNGMFAGACVTMGQVVFSFLPSGCTPLTLYSQQLSWSIASTEPSLTSPASAASSDSHWTGTAKEYPKLLFRLVSNVCDHNISGNKDSSLKLAICEKKKSSSTISVSSS